MTVPDGWKLVPLEPTHEMLLAYSTAWVKYDIKNMSLGATGAHEYRMMLAAAPLPPPNAIPGEKA